MDVSVSVPLRGIGSEKQFEFLGLDQDGNKVVSVPLRGIGSEKRGYTFQRTATVNIVSVPLRGIGSEKPL